MNTKIDGNIGEAIAFDYLVKNKYKIVKTNYSCKLGEIDIVCLDKDVLVFVEVKNRNSTKFGLPREAVTITKQMKIRRVAEMFIRENKLYNTNVRFDVIEILNGKLEHLKGCF